MSLVDTVFDRRVEYVRCKVNEAVVAAAGNEAYRKLLRCKSIDDRLLSIHIQIGCYYKAHSRLFTGCLDGKSVRHIVE